jgi:PEGA domain
MRQRRHKSSLKVALIGPFCVALFLQANPLRSAFAEVPSKSSDKSEGYAAAKKRGDALFAERRYEEALSAYDDAYRAEANPAVDYNRSSTLDALTRFPEALDSIERFEKNASADLKAKVPGLLQYIVDLRAKVATVEIAVNVQSARVLLRGVEVSASKAGSAAAPIRVNAGPAKIEALAEGFGSVSETRSLLGGQVTKVRLELIAREAELVVTSPKSGAFVLVDEKDLGLSPAKVKLAAGQHNVRVTLDGHADALATLSLRAGETRTLSLDPIKKLSFFVGPVFWTLVGVVVVGTAVGISVYAATTERAPPSGVGYSPGKIAF